MAKSRLGQLLWEKSDITCALTGLAVMIITLVALEAKDFHPIYSVAVLTGIACIILYLCLRPRLTEEEESAEGRPYCWLTASAALIACGVVLFALRPSEYTKPLPYYIVMALASGTLVLAALRTNSPKQMLIVITAACAIGVTHVATENLLFPDSLIGIDPWYHSDIVTRELASGHTQVDLGVTTIGTSYSLMHLFLRFIMNILPISYKTASLLFVGIPLTVGNIALAGLVSKRLLGFKVGAVTAVVLCTANWQLFFGEWIIPNAIGATMALAVAYLMLTQKGGWLRVIPVMLILCAAYFTHLVAAVWVVGTIACLSAIHVLRAAKGLMNHEPKRQPIMTLAMFTVVLVSLPMWLVGTTAGKSVSITTGEYSFNPSFGLTSAVTTAITDDTGTIAATNITTTTTTTTTTTSTTSTAPDTTTQTPPQPVREMMRKGSLQEITFDSIGMILYIGLAIAGALVIIRRRWSASRQLWVLLGLTVLAIGFFPPLFGKSLLEHRWWYFAEVLLSVPLAVLLVSLTKGRAGVAAVTGLVVVIAFTSTIGLPANMTNRSLSPNLIVRYAFTEKELDGLQQVMRMEEAVIGTDPLYRGLIMSNSNYAGLVESIDNNLTSGDFYSAPSSIVIRDAISREPFGFGGSTIYSLDYDIVETAEYQGYKEVWDNGEVHVLTRGDGGFTDPKPDSPDEQLLIQMIYQRLERQIAGDTTGWGKVEAVNSWLYVNEEQSVSWFVLPIVVIDYATHLDFVRGIGWCDQKVAGMRDLLYQDGIQVRALWFPHHTIAEVKVGEETRYYDPAFNTRLLNVDGRFVREDGRPYEGDVINTEDPVSVQEFPEPEYKSDWCFSPAAERWMDQYLNSPRFQPQIDLDVVPEWLRSKYTDPDYRVLYRGRVYQLCGMRGKAASVYEMLLDSEELRDEAVYYLVTLGLESGDDRMVRQHREMAKGEWTEDDWNYLSLVEPYIERFQEVYGR